MASQKVHGITIELDANASGVSEAFKDINKDIRNAQQELRAVDKLLKLNPNNVVLLTQKQGLLTDAIEKTQDKLIQLAKAKAKAEESGEIDKNSKQYRELERDIVATRNTLEKLNKEAEENEKAMNGAYEGTKKYDDEVKETTKNTSTFGDVLKANVVSDFIIKGISSLTNAFKRLGDSIYNAVRDAGAYADDVNTLAKQFNLSTKEIQQYIKASDLIDVDINTIAKSMSKLTKNMASASKTTQETFKKIGVATKEASGELRDSNEVFNEVIEALGKIENETEQDAVAMDIFGKSASDLGSLINGGAEQLAEFNKYLEENNLLLSQKELDSLNEMNDAFDTLKATTDSLIQKIASDLAPVLTPIVNNIVQYLVDNKDKIEELVKNVIDYLTSEEAKEFYSKIIETVKKVGDAIGDFIRDYPTIKQDLDLLVTPIKLIADLISGIVDAIKFINDNAISSNIFDMYSASGFSGFVPQYDPSIWHSGGFGALQSGGFSSNVTINVNNNGQPITYSDVRGWADVINEELGMRM